MTIPEVETHAEPNQREYWRIHTVTAGDPVSAYFGFPETQLDILRDEQSHEAVCMLEQTTLAAERLGTVMEPTPLELSADLSAELGCTVLYKRDDQTPIDTFKLRGAFNKIMGIDDEVLTRGVIAASAGNHARGVAYAGAHRGTPVTIVMPTTTPETKISAVAGLGAEIVLHGDSFSDAYSHSLALQEELGATYVHPFDDPEVIAGQATVALEILQDNPAVTHIFVPVGGGGLLAGVIGLVKEVAPHVKVIGVEPDSSNMMTRSLVANEVIETDHVGTFADGVAVKRVGDVTFEAAKQADGMINVSDDDICIAAANFVTETGAVLEPAGALSIAGLKSYAASGQLPEDAVAVAICSGANVDTTRLLHMLTRAEKLNELNTLLRIQLPEHPGALRTLCETAINGHNITQFSYRKNSANSEAQITVGLRVRDSRDKASLTRVLTQHGYLHHDLTDNRLLQEHGVQPVGDSPNPETESFFALEFDDRPGALLQLLTNLGDDWNISMFHYGGSEGDTGRVVIGFEGTDREALQSVLKQSTRSFVEATDDVMLMYA